MGATTYKIKKGDTLSGISQRTGVSVADIAKANGISNPNKIYAGATIKIPSLTNSWGTKANPNTNSTHPNGQNNIVVNEDKNPYTNISLSQFEGGYQKSDDVIAAEKKKANAENAVANRGSFWDSYDDTDRLGIMDAIKNYKDFSFDLNGDALYQQYKDKYIQQGKMAMQDTMGQAAAMTGGYGNSYAATAGNQAYQASLENLNDIVPELYQMAYDKYNMEKQDLYNQYSMLSDDMNTKYGIWSDETNRLYTDRDYYSNEANNALNYDYGMWSDKRDYTTNQYWNETNWGYGQEQDKLENAKSDAWSMIQAGVLPSDEALEAAGISKADAEAVVGVYNKQIEGSESPNETTPNETTPKGVNMEWDHYQDFLEDTDGYILKNDKIGLERYLDGLVENGLISEEYAVSFWISCGYDKEEFEEQDTDVQPTKTVAKPPLVEDGNSFAALQAYSMNRIPLGNNVPTSVTTPTKKKAKSTIRFTR